MFVDIDCQWNPFYQNYHSSQSLDLFGMDSHSHRRPSRKMFFRITYAISEVIFINAGAPSDPLRTSRGSQTGDQVCYVFLIIKRKLLQSMLHIPVSWHFEIPVIYTQEFIELNLSVRPKTLYSSNICETLKQLAVGCSAYVVRALTARENNYRETNYVLSCWPIIYDAMV